MSENPNLKQAYPIRDMVRREKLLHAIHVAVSWVGVVSFIGLVWLLIWRFAVGLDRGNW